MGWLALVQCIMGCFTRRRDCSKRSGWGKILHSLWGGRGNEIDSSASLHFPLCPLGGAIHFLPSPPSPFVAHYRHTPHVSWLHGQGREQVRKKHLLFGLKCTIKEIKRVKKYNKKGEGKDSVYTKMSSAPSVGPLHRTPQVSTRSCRKTQKKEWIMHKQTNHTLCTTN